MRGIAFLFVFTAAICVTLGMAWGIQMGISGNHDMAPAHAHLNLVGWVTMALFGIYYHLVPQAALSGLAKLHYAVAVAGVGTMVPGIALAISESGEVLAKVGSLLTFASMLIFVVTLLRSRSA